MNYQVVPLTLNKSVLSATQSPKNSQLQYLYCVCLQVIPLEIACVCNVVPQAFPLYFGQRPELPNTKRTKADSRTSDTPFVYFHLFRNHTLPSSGVFHFNRPLVSRKGRMLLFAK